MERPLRVAIAGASGIGKHHAKWFHRVGAQVVGFLGRSRESATATERVLRDIFPFSGQGYWDLDRLLIEEVPNVVDVCLPNEAHFDCVKYALEGGCHVLCEKPLAWHSDGAEQTLMQARALVDLAQQTNLHLGVCTQYAASLPYYRQLYEEARGSLATVESFYAEMETLARGRRRSAAEVWIDMASHPLSMLLAWMPDGVIESASLQVVSGSGEVRACFSFADSSGSCRCEIIVRDLHEGQPLRRFGVNGFLVDCTGRSAPDGTYCSVLSKGESELIGDDFMSLLIAQFAKAAVQSKLAPLVSGEVGLRNLELQLQVLQNA
ncbi:MAG: Gfo/Idh/MocA family oxidoreductase [Gemmatimonadetes bacterium]|nr:Gfo/Idh/MocA family oxidoreductase [Gemmatimonadota bacterium]MDE2732862.1 Gfo/Idh/MocA family oxidoreductase [Gemmatimonadota bacterium]